MNKLRTILWEFAPGEWKSFVMGWVCLSLGIWNMGYDNGYSHGVAVFVSVMAGVCFAASVFEPKFKDMQQEFRDMEQRWHDFQPEAAGKRAAAEFREELLAMQARGEIPEHCQIVFEPGEHEPPRGRLN